MLFIKGLLYRSHNDLVVECRKTTFSNDSFYGVVIVSNGTYCYPKNYVSDTWVAMNFQPLQFKYLHTLVNKLLVRAW